MVELSFPLAVPQQIQNAQDNTDGHKNIIQLSNQRMFSVPWAVVAPTALRLIRGAFRMATMIFFAHGLVEVNGERD